MATNSSVHRTLSGLRGEIRKSISPTIGIIFFLAFGVMLASITFAANFADTQADVLPNVDAMAAQIDAACLDNPDDSSDECVASRLQAQATNEFSTQANRLGEIGNALSTPPGVIRFVSHHWATTIGWILVALIAAFHVAGEWNAGSIGVTAQSVGSRPRFVALKIASTWIIALAGMAFVAAALTLGRPLFSTDGMISNAAQSGTVALGVDPAWSSWTTALTDAAIAAAVLLAVSTLAVGFAVTLRRPIPTVFAMLAVLITMFLAGPASWMPSQAIAKWLEFNTVNDGLISDHLLWNYPGVNDTITDPLSTIALAPGLTIILIAAAALVTAATIVTANNRRAL